MKRLSMALPCLLVACLGDAVVANPPTDGGTNQDAAATTMSIPTLRNPAAPGHPTTGATVTIEGAIVTGVKSAGATHGFFIQDPNVNEWAATFVVVGAVPVSVAPGAVVTVTGKMLTYRGFDELDASGGTTTLTGSANVPAPLDVTPNDIRAGSATADKYQSMLLRIKAVKAKTATNAVDFTVNSAAGNDDLYVTSYMANDTGPSPFPATVGQTFTSITGHGYKFGSSDATAVAKLAPLSAAQLVTP